MNQSNHSSLQAIYSSLKLVLDEVAIENTERAENERMSADAQLESSQKIEYLTTQVDVLTQANLILKQQHVDVLEKYQQTLDEIDAMRKVSHIIAIERENAKLRREIDVLQKGHVKVTVAQVTVPTIVEAKEIHAPLPLPPLVEDVGEEVNEDVQVYEKKFNKKPYYVSDDDNMTIYEILEDGAIGAELGYCKKESGKMKPIWN